MGLKGGRQRQPYLIRSHMSSVYHKKEQPGMDLMPAADYWVLPKNTGWMKIILVH